MSKQRNFRPRAKLPLDEDEDDTKPPSQQQQQQQQQPSSKPAAGAAGSRETKAGAAPSSKSSLLSFDEDGEGGLDIGNKPVAKKKDRSKTKLRVPLPEVPVVTSTSQRTGAGGLHALGAHFNAMQNTAAVQTHVRFVKQHHLYHLTYWQCALITRLSKCYV